MGETGQSHSTWPILALTGLCEGRSLNPPFLQHLLTAQQDREAWDTGTLGNTTQWTCAPEAGQAGTALQGTVNSAQSPKHP